MKKITKKLAPYFLLLCIFTSCVLSCKKENKTNNTITLRSTDPIFGQLTDNIKPLKKTNSLKVNSTNLSCTYTINFDFEVDLTPIFTAYDPRPDFISNFQTNLLLDLYNFGATSISLSGTTVSYSGIDLNSHAHDFVSQAMNDAANSLQLSSWQVNYMNVQTINSCAPDNGGTGSGPPPTSEDPCNATKAAAASTLNSIISGNTSITSAITTTANYGTNNQEAAFRIENSGTTYVASPPIASAPGTEESNTYIDDYTVGIAHGHLISGFPEPSAHDLYDLGTTNAAHPNVTFGIITSPTDTYAIVVSSPADFAAFSSAHPYSEVVGSDNDFNKNTDIGTQLNDKIGINTAAYYYVLNGIDPSHSTPEQDNAAANYAQEAEIVYFLSHYSTGITLLKMNKSTFTFQPLHVEATPLPNGQNAYSPKPCN